MKLEEVNALPAYAVYKNMIPGVKVYQDTNTPRKNKRQKKKKNKGGSQEPQKVPLKSEKPVSTPVSLAKTVGSGDRPRNSSEFEKGKNKKRKADAVAQAITPLSGAKNAKRAKAEVVNKTAEANKNAVINGTPKKKSKGKNKQKQGESVNIEINSGVESTQRDPGVKGKKTKKIVKEGITNEIASNTTKKAANIQLKQSVSPAASKSVANHILPRSQSSCNEQDEMLLASLMSSKCVENSVEHGKNLFQWLISPTPVTKFMSDYWEKEPLLVKRSDDPDYYKWLLSSAKMDEILRKNMIRFGKNIDITSYTNGQRETHNPVGRAMPAMVWDYYSNACSVRFLNPQTYVKPLWRLNALLQEYLGTFVGANVYLTPPDSQGFAPHYDDIEAFVLQVEGKKHWKVYKPRKQEEELPRFSSTNFSEDEIGKPILDVVLEEGDLLYFPRGFIHQAKAVGEHSLHITISCYQLNSWGELMKEYFNSAVDQAMANSVDFRKGLPLDYLSYMGLAHQDKNDKNTTIKRKTFISNTKKLASQLLEFTTPDHAADQMGKKFIWDSLPPFLSAREKNTTSANDGEFMEEGQVFNRCELDPDVEVKLVRKNCVRLVFEERSYRLYFSLENSMEYHGEEAQFVEIPEDAKDAIVYLISKYPEFVKIDDLPIEDITTKVQLVADLWEKGIVLTKNPLSATWDESLMDSDGSEEEESDDDNESELSEDLGSEDSLEDDSDDEGNGFSYDYDEFIEDNFGEGADFIDDSDLEIDSEDYHNSDQDSNHSQDSKGLGKSFIEEVTSGDELNGHPRKGNESSEDDVPPKLISIRRKQNKKSKSKISK